jgi:hypothetical protein
MIIQGQVGAPAGTNAPGSTPAIRQGQLGDMIVSELHGRFYEQAYRGAIYSTFVNALTLASTHASPIAAGTGTPIIGIYNPANSGKNIVLIRLQQATTSGTPGGPLVWNIIPNPQNITASTTASGNTAYNNSSLAQSGSVARLFNNLPVTGSTAGTAFRNAGGPTAVAATGAILTYTEVYDGSLILPPGQMLGLACTAAGTSHVINVFAEWEEIPV